MPNRTLYTTECAINEANVIKLSIANPAATPTPTVGKLRFFDGTLVPDVTTVKTQLVAAETTLTGYPVGGYDVDEMSGPLLSALGGVAITTPLTTVAYASGDPATLGGAWLEDPTGKVRAVFVFDPQITLAAIPDGIEFVRQLFYGRNTITG